MKRTIDEHAARFDQQAREYDQLERPVYSACVDLVIEHADPRADEVVLDLGTGTGAIALSLSAKATQVIGRDISTEMLDVADRKATERGIENVSFDTGSFRSPNYEGPAHVITSNYAMHHLDDEGKREAIGVIADFRPRRFVLGDVMFFGDPDPADPDYDPAVDDPATAGMLVVALTDAGFDIRDVIAVSDQVGVIVAEEPRNGWSR